jgi:hypothetical protein
MNHVSSSGGPRRRNELGPSLTCFPTRAFPSHLRCDLQSGPATNREIAPADWVPGIRAVAARPVHIGGRRNQPNAEPVLGMNRRRTDVEITLVFAEPCVDLGV